MAKQSGKKDRKGREEKARRDLAKAQLLLHSAQEKRAQAITRGERAVERARQRAARWLEKATERVERRAGATARAEARLIALSHSDTAQQLPPPIRAKPATAPVAESAAAAAEEAQNTDRNAAVRLIEERAAEASNRAYSSPFVVPETVEIAPSEETTDTAGNSEGDSLHPW